VTTYVKIWENFKVIFNMNLVLFWFIIYLSLSTEVLSHVVFSADETPEKYVREQQMARRFPQRSRHRHFKSPRAIPRQRPAQGLTYRLTGRSSSSGNISPSADNLSNPRYYEDKQNLPDNLHVIPQVFPRQSKSREDYDRFALDPNPEHQILETSQQAEQETSNERAEIETSNFAKAYLADETSPENDHPLKITVPTDLDYKLDTNFIIFVVGCSTAAVAVLTIIGVWIWYKCYKKANKEFDVKDDGRLSQSGHMYHFHHQKRQILGIQSSNGPPSETDGEEESEMELILNKFSR
jgi:hypothetical protein